MPPLDFANPDQEMVSDFFADFEEAYQAAERLLLKLERSPQDTALLADLFRRVHTIKGNLIYIGLADICPLLQSVEDVLEPLRQGKIAYDDLLSDVILLAMDNTHKLVDSRLHGQPAPMADDQIPPICAAISKLADCTAEQRPKLIHHCIAALNSEIETPLEAGHEFSDFGIDPNQDLNFFSQLLPAIDQRSPYWQGRTRRIAQLALNMNRAANNPIDPSQLLAAVYMHDFGMAFLPLSLLHKPGTYTEGEREQVRAHLHIAVDLLRTMGTWDDAAEMVAQHHETMNGTGYPDRLNESQICDGAKIIAIVDAFDACVNSRAHVNLPQRPLIRAILEINRYAGSQFSQYWVDVFNTVARPNNRT
ncbi:HD domain-containing phosphohydrolase [Simiduia aestuariiviva]|uniref:HD-GYP domain-containing protein (C-di-GMP phosphodiesterase class II) n=1 Tax=Simiduia aestuariiviva TaxID=1510459 RepID=A0A839UQT9_9GAMM|nr:HD domain-containing phosphohydrolase [Simiduia aestuariiviva]MBB3168870.1 HD-GYP domain-containing protein (c-di-GMP phosphodiesterase class II) [Simiduia aestuariiviva]